MNGNNYKNQLITACKNGSFTQVKSFMLNCQENDLDEAFKQACLSGHLDIAKFLLEQDEFNGKSIIMSKIIALKDAVRKENFPLIELLMSNIKTQMTPISLDALHIAMESSKKTCVKYLLVDLNIEVSPHWNLSFLRSSSYKQEMKDYYKEIQDKLVLYKNLDNVLYNKARNKSVKI